MSNKTELIKREAIEDGAINADKIAPASITAEKLHPSAASGVLDNSIDTQHLINYAVTGIKIASTIDGIKTFSSIPLGPNENPTTANQFSRKGYVDTKVSLTGDELIDGIKTFNFQPIHPTTQVIDWNNAIENGIYSGNNASNAPGAGLWMGDVIKYNNDWIIQTIYPFTMEGVNPLEWRLNGFVRRLKNGVWESWGKISLQDYPVGERYIQYPEPDGTFDSNKSPETKFGGEWVCIFADEGTFFKTEGHEPAQIYDNNVLVSYRVNGLSKDKSQRLYGHVSGNCNVWNPPHGGVHLHSGSNGISGGSGGSPAATIHFMSERSPSARTTTDTAGRTEPQNRLMKIWERIV